MANTRPTPSQIRQSFVDHNVDAKYWKDWDTSGKPWGSDGGGLYAAVVHHTATASAVEGNGAPTLYWAVNAYSPMKVANQLVGKDPGTNWILSGNGTYHSGNGGPWKDVGVGVGNVLHWRAWGIEIDDPGTGKTINKYQIEQTARVLASLWDLCGWPDDGSRIITHGDWTDSGPYLGESSYGPWIGRKNDTLRNYYDQNFWRKEASKYRIGKEMWDGTIPTLTSVQRAVDQGRANKATWRIACRLYDLGFTKRKPSALGKQKYPKRAVKEFQKSIGWKVPHGNFSLATQNKMFGKEKK